MNMKKGIEALQNTYSHLLDAHKSYQDFLKARKQQDTEGISANITNTMLSVTRLCERVTEEREQPNNRIYGRGLLRVKFFGGSHIRELTVQRPDNISDNPYISEASYNALKFAFGTSAIYTMDRHFAVDVIAPSGKKVTTIRGLI